MICPKCNSECEEGSSFCIKCALSEEDDYTRKGYEVYNLLTGATLDIKKDEEFYMYSNYIIIEKNNKKLYYNTKLEKIYEE